MKSLSKADRTRGFHVHAVVFAVTMLMLAAINLWTGSPYWVLWVLPAWSIGVVSHWWFVLGPGARNRRITGATYAMGSSEDSDKR